MRVSRIGRGKQRLTAGPKIASEKPVGTESATRIMDRGQVRLVSGRRTEYDQIPIGTFPTSDLKKRSELSKQLSKIKKLTRYGGFDR